MQKSFDAQGSFSPSTIPLDFFNLARRMPYKLKHTITRRLRSPFETDADTLDFFYNGIDYAMRFYDFCNLIDSGRPRSMSYKFLVWEEDDTEGRVCYIRFRDMSKYLERIDWSGRDIARALGQIMSTRTYVPVLSSSSPPGTGGDDEESSSSVEVVEMESLPSRKRALSAAPSPPRAAKEPRTSRLDAFMDEMRAQVANLCAQVSDLRAQIGEAVASIGPAAVDRVIQSDEFQQDIAARRAEILAEIRIEERERLLAEEETRTRIAAEQARSRVAADEATKKALRKIVRAARELGIEIDVPEARIPHGGTIIDVSE